jgi:hypothetical protein
MIASSFSRTCTRAARSLRPAHSRLYGEPLYGPKITAHNGGRPLYERPRAHQLLQRGHAVHQPGDLVPRHLQLALAVRLHLAHPQQPLRQEPAVGRGHVSLLTNSDTWHSKLVRDMGYL